MHWKPSRPNSGTRLSCAPFITIKIASNASPSLDFPPSLSIPLIGVDACRPVIFKNTGTVAFAYEWSALNESEGVDPPEVSSVAELIEKNAQKGIFPREHYLSAERSSIFCMKAKGIILPGEVVRTLFNFSSRGAGGVVCGVWALSTVPRANIAVDPEGIHLHTPPHPTPLVIHAVMPMMFAL